MTYSEDRGEQGDQALPTSDQDQGLEAPDMAPQKRTTSPASSFVFHPVEWLINSHVQSLSLHKQGKLFMRIVRAVAARDHDTVKQWQGTLIGRVYWRDPSFRQAIPLAIRRAVYERDANQCTQCGSVECLEIDHIMPLSKGGEDTFENLQVLCLICNRRKGARL